MILKKKEFFLLIFLIFLQSWSGGRIGNFLESSFNDLEKTSKNEDLQNNLLNKNDINLEKENKKFDDKKNKKIKNLSKKRKIELQSYKIIFILKDVDPKDPTEELSSILSNSEVNFEIEKIERILDSKNKTMNKNWLKIFNKNENNNKNWSIKYCRDLVSRIFIGFIMGCLVLFANWGSFIKVDFTPPNNPLTVEKRY